MHRPVQYRTNGSPHDEHCKFSLGNLIRRCDVALKRAGVSKIHRKVGACDQRSTIELIGTAAYVGQS